MRRLSHDAGNALLEGVGFAAVAFGLLFSLGMYVLSLERDELALESIARNSMRAYLLDISSDLPAAVSRFQTESILSSQAIQIEISCTNDDCTSQGNLIWLKLTTDELSARAFGVIDE